MFDFDLFVIGAGSGGVRAARIASENGAKVAIAEEYRVGGTCVIRGCIPKKLMVYASQFAEEFEDAAGFGWTVRGAFDWATLIKNKDAEIDRLNGLYFKTLAANNVKLFEARATLKDKNTVQVDDQEITAKTILVATGGAPYIPDIPGAEHAISSNEVFHLKKLPKRLLIIGAGYIAVEFAGIFNSLGVETTVGYRKNLVLRGFDEDLRTHLTSAMQARGIRFFFNTILTKIEKTKDGLKVTDSNDDQGVYDVILCAVGRLPNTAGMGLEEIGVKLAENGAVEVDEFSRSSVDNIFAVGDVTDRINLTPVAIREGHAF
ncbi:MAG: FAD-dependent oxidoreductase, partial [Sphingomonadales bacterium]